MRLLALDYPADEIADAVMSGDDAAIAEVDVSRHPVWLIVHRGRNGVDAQRLDRDAYAYVTRLCDGDPLGCLLENAPAEVPALIADQLTKGRLKAFRIDKERSS
ncbi:MAG: hypothetical protein H0X11_13725 [Betaproteobacteria bacterium]|nr:hypothetical protein [Betaproteobacteria bacterium]